MKATVVVRSGAPGGKTYMGWWGNMGGPKQKGMIYYSVSPFKQQAMKGAFSGYFFHGYKRIASHFPYFIVPVSLGYWTYTWSKERYDFLNSKAGHLAEHH